MTLAYKLLAIDVDGTLMNARDELSPGNRAALHRAHEAGLKVCLCTGRSLTEAQSVLDAVGLDSDAGVFVFGAIVSALPSGQTLHLNGLEPSLAERLIRHFRAQGFPVLVLYDRTTAGLDYRLIDGGRSDTRAEQWLAVTPTEVVRLDSWTPITADPVRVGIILEPEDVPEATDYLERAFGRDEIKYNVIFAPNYRLHVLECFAPQVNKWHGLTQLADDLGIDGAEIAAIGDDVNDIEMIRHAGLGIAMGNAKEIIRQLARWQAPTHDEDGVAAAIDAILTGRI